MHIDRKVRDILVSKLIDVFRVRYTCIISLNFKRKKNVDNICFCTAYVSTSAVISLCLNIFVQNLLLATTPTIIIIEHLLRVLNPKVAVC